MDECKLDTAMVNTLSTIDGRSNTDLATDAARHFDRTLMNCARKVCGVRRYNPRHTRPGYTNEVKLLRVKLSILGHNNRKECNCIRHRISCILSRGKAKSLEKQIKRCELGMRRNDPMTI